MSDVRGFTALAECLEPQEVMTFLNRYLEAMVEVILAYRGTIIEILGDGLLVLFGAPLTRDDDAERAVACALAMQLRLARHQCPASPGWPAGRRHGHWHSHRGGGGGPYWLPATHQVWRGRQRGEPHRAH